jgi:Ca2+-binding RTX toxin-like protein
MRATATTLDEALATSGEGFGNYVMFEIPEAVGLSSSDGLLSLRVDNVEIDGRYLGLNRPALSAVQVVGQRLDIDRVQTTDPEYAGNDTILTGDGPDLVMGGSGNDVIDAAGTAEAYGEADVVVGDEGRATLVNGAVTLVHTIAKASDSTLIDDDIISTGNGPDVVLGGNGSDIIDAVGSDSNDRDFVIGDDGAIRLFKRRVTELQASDTALDDGGFHTYDDHITTGGDKDIVLGGYGNDTIEGGTADDYLVGDNGRILFFKGEVAQIDLISATISGDDTFIFAGGNLGVDRVFEAGNDSGLTNDPHDMLDFGDLAGPVTLDLKVTDLQVVNPDHLTLQLSSGTGVEDVIGSDFDDEIHGNLRANTIEGNEGDDLLEGREGDDIYVFIGENLGFDTIIEEANRDRDTLDFEDFGGSVILDLAVTDLQVVNDDHLTLQLSSDTSIEDVIGSVFDDEIRGNTRDNTIEGRAGNDFISGHDLEPLAYWNLNETSGEHVADSAGTAQDGFFFDSNDPDLDDAGPPLSVAPFGAHTGAHFHDTKKEYIAVAHDPVFEVAQGTVHLWFNTDDEWNSQTLLSKDHSSKGTGGHLDISLDDRRLKVRLQSIDDEFFIHTGKVVDDDRWYQLVFTFGEQGMKLYLNGELVGENGYTGGLIGNREPLVIGASIKSNKDDSGDLSELDISVPFDGFIDEVALFGVALNEEQIDEMRVKGVASGSDNDTIEGGTGNDELVGGGGNDTYIFAGGNLGSDTITEEPNQDRDTLDFKAFAGSVNVDLADIDPQTVNPTHLNLTLSSDTGIEDAIGSLFADVIHGNSRDNFISGEEGNDFISRLAPR